MVSLTPRFLLLAALCAAAMPSLVLVTDGRAVEIGARHRYESTSVSHPTSTLAKGKGKDREVPTPIVPLPTHSNSKATNDDKEGRKHKKNKSKGRKKDEKRDVYILRGQRIARDPEHRHHHDHHDHDHDRRDGEAQAAFSLKKRHHHHDHDHHRHERDSFNPDLEKRVVSRIYGKQSLKRSDQGRSVPMESWDLLDSPILQVGVFQISGDHRAAAHRPAKREPHHHHHHDHHDHDEMVVKGNNDNVNVHQRRSPHDHDRHHGKVIVNGENDNVHVHERRSPHHHDHYGHGETVINGNNDDVHVHERHVPSDTADDTIGINAEVDIGDGILSHSNTLSDDNTCWTPDGRRVKCEETYRSHQQKRSDSVDGMSGVPGTVDIMNIGPIANQRLASLVLSTVSDNSTTNGTASGTYSPYAAKGTADPDSPFILDASNTTQTQFYLVVSEPAVQANGTLADTLAALNAVAASKSTTDNDGVPSASDIKVTLQVPVFEPAEAAMRAYCATFDPNPPAPAPLYMDACFDELDASSNASDPSVHKSQTFAYDPVSGTIKPVWYAGNSTGTDSSSSNSTSNSTSTSTSNSTTDSTGAQMDFKVENANKDALLPAPPALPVPVPVANVTQTVDGTASSTPLNGTLSSTPLDGVASSAPINGAGGPLNVTLVFTPAAPAVHVVENASGIASFEPVGSDDSSDGVDDSATSSSEDSGSAADSGNGTDTTDGGSNSDADSDVSTSSVSVTNAATSTDSSLATPTDSNSEDTSDESTGSTESAGAPEPTSTSATTISTTSNATDVMMDASTASPTDPEATTTTTSASTLSGSSMTTTPSSTLTPTADTDAAIEMYQQEPVNELC